MPPLQRVSILVSVVAMVIAWTVGPSAQTTDLLSGTWRNSLAKSRYTPADLAPKSGTTKIEIVRDQIKVVTDGIDAEGRKTHSEYTARFDGRDYPWIGTVDGRPNPDQESVAWTRIDDYTYVTTNKLKGRTLTTSHISIFRDGKTRTNTVAGRNARGQTVNNVIVFEKQ